MSLKNIELQIAIPRVSEVGRHQNDYMQRPSHEQALLGQQTHKESLAQRQRSAEVDSSSSATIRDGDGEQHRHDPETHAARHEEEAAAAHPAEHPYKGHHIDLTL
ncbi:hypothetical protein Q5741_05170 [Paenibacillus sp. JX-17]|uniref:Uncharacterized protein n=1 Tax=Paenibacillus lacisoli TaxID=3064525 RepID=A0ABT9C969_9BACL|nr:hypothetical protein [Paenibacillus sp. JX-17]MDO7905805.1 hypothetical protein [Paenibacillus sp. JX-17]